MDGRDWIEEAAWDLDEWAGMGGRRFGQMGAGSLDERSPKVRMNGWPEVRMNERPEIRTYGAGVLDEWLTVVRSNLRAMDGWMDLPWYVNNPTFRLWIFKHVSNLLSFNGIARLSKVPSKDKRISFLLESLSQVWVDSKSVDTKFLSRRVGNLSFLCETAAIDFDRKYPLLGPCENWQSLSLVSLLLSACSLLVFL